jgi:APA family basic amino acid/polyamine antiporter
VGAGGGGDLHAELHAGADYFARALVAYVMSESKPMATLVRTLKLKDIYSLFIGSVIGSGIFLVPAEILRKVHGSVGLSLGVWIAGGLLSLLGALTYGELAAMNPAAGGLYVYIREAFGNLTAFLYGWTLFLVIGAGTMATLAVAFSLYLNPILEPRFHLSPIEMKVISVAMIALLTLVNVIGVRYSAFLQNWTTLIKVTAILAMCAGLLYFGRGYSASYAALWPAHFDGSILAGFGLAMIPVLWAYEGWQWVSYSAGEMVNAQRDFPRASLAGGLTLITIYLIPVCAYLAALGPIEAAKSDTIAAAAVSAMWGPNAAKLVAAMILVSVFSAANSTILMAPRVFYAMAKDKLFFRQLAEVHPRFRTPAIAIVTSAVWASVLAWTGTFNQLLAYVIFAGWIFYGLAGASLFVFRARKPDAVRPYRVPWYPLTPALFVGASGVVVLNSLIADWGNSRWGLLIMALGLPVYLFWRKSARKDSADPHRG